MKVQKTTIKSKTMKNTDIFTSTETRKQISKNLQMASDSQRGQQPNVEIIQVIGFIKETVQKLKTFGEKFKVQLDSDWPNRVNSKLEQQNIY